MKTAFALMASVALLAGCSKSEKHEEVSANGGTTTVAPTKVAEGSTGVPECDNYMNKVMACINDKVPEAQRGMVKQGIDQAKAQWANVTDKGALAQSCKMAMDQAKASYGAMGCKF